jgi:hypothetical protein
MPGIRLTRRSGTALVPLTVAALLTALSPAVTATFAVPVTQLSTADLVTLRVAGARPAGRAAAVAAVARAKQSEKGLPSFTSSFTTDGVTYPYTMLGAAPASGRTTELKTVVVPLTMVFTGFDQDATFDPAFAVRNMLRSPIYNDATYLNGRGQFGDQLQRATFWNQMDAKHQWHTKLADPDLSRTFTITVTPGTGQLETYHGAAIGNMNIDAFDAELHAILPKLHLDPDQTPLFVTQSVTADALGYHDAFMVPNGHGGQRVQTLMWSSWLDVAQVGPLLADISTLNHEVGEWIDDPFVDNLTPAWAFPPFNQECGDVYLEVGDPQGNGPDYALFPTVPMTLNGYTYHLQDLVMLPWFSRQSPSTAYRGWYAFPDPTQITTPSVDCPTV